MTPSTAVATQPRNVREYIDSGMMTMQLRQTMGDQRTAQRMARAVINSVTMTPALAECNLDSFRVAVMHAAVCNLIPGPSGHAAIIPYKKVATFQPMYKGIVQQLWRSDQIATIVTKTVDANDQFTERVGEPPLHEVSPDPAGGDYTHVYALIGIKGGGWIVEVWNRAQVLAHRDKYSKAWSKKGKTSPWGTAEAAMAKKTVLLQAAKLAPISEEASASIAAYELAEQGKTTFEAAVVDIKADVSSQLAGMVEEERARQDNGDQGSVQNGKEEQDAAEAPGIEPSRPQNESASETAEEQQQADAAQQTSDTSPAPDSTTRNELKGRFEQLVKSIGNLDEDSAFNVLYDIAELEGGDRNKSHLTAAHYRHGIADMANLVALAQRYQGPTADEIFDD